MQFDIDYHWYRDSHSLLGFTLLPLSLLFGAVVSVRRALYRSGIKKTYHAPVPVIVVGNITVGGTGKTPLVIWLTNFLQAQGFKPGVISRGYGGDGKLKLVDQHADPRIAGDEAVLIARRTKRPVVTAIDRVAALKKILAETDTNIVISDDGLQHYHLGRQLELAMVDGERRFGNQSLLPSGPLREPVSRLTQVDFIVTQQNPLAAEYLMRLAGDEVVAVNANEKTRRLQDFYGTKVHAVAAIGNPRQFFSRLRAQGITVIEHVFPDHYYFKPQDLTFADDLPVIMTEKDAVKCQDQMMPNHWYLPVTAEMNQLFSENILKKIGVTPHA
jgi:tetraacyldisaccharide 4'-kinase